MKELAILAACSLLAACSRGQRDTPDATVVAPGPPVLLERVVQLEEAVEQMSEQLENLVEQIEESAGKSETFENYMKTSLIKFEDLEEKARELESTIQELQSRSASRRSSKRKYSSRRTSPTGVSSRASALRMLVDALEEKVRRLESTEAAKESDQWALRTCDEIRAFHPSARSGQYKIDPDGVNSGDPAIWVHCDMASGMTSVSHNSEEAHRLSDCVGAACQRWDVVYNSTMRQLISLLRQSRQCRQSFVMQFECQENGVGRVESSGWVDRSNTSRSFASCRQQEESDSLCSVSLCPDLSRSEMLPVTQLHFGRRSSESSPQQDATGSDRGRFYLGKFQCSGTVDVAPPSIEEQDALVSKSSNGKKVCPKKAPCFDMSPSFGCYCFYQVSKTWSEANQFCLSKGMQLVSIESKEEQDILVTLLKPIGNYLWWTSGSDEAEEGHWIWTATGQPFQFHYWSSGQPDGGAKQNFMLLDWPNNGHQWVDQAKTDQRYPICES